MKHLLFCILFLAKVNFAEANFRVKLGFDLARNNYIMQTSADSILKWRDANIIKSKLEIEYKNISLNLKYGFIQSGVMTDDDLSNLFSLPTCKPSSLCDGIWSRTKGMKGKTFEGELLFNSRISTINQLKFDFISGFSYKNFLYQPYGIYQIAINVNENSGSASGFTTNQDGEFQYADFKVFGTILGLGLEYEGEKYNFKTALLGFIALYGKSDQDKWGYGRPGPDWYIKNGNTKIFGIKLKVENNMKITKNFSFGVFTEIDYMKGFGLTECGTQETNDCYGTINYLTNLSLSAGFQFILQ